MESKERVQTIEAFIAASPESVRDKLRELRSAIRKAAPSATETIRYGIPTFVLEGNLVHFGASKHHIGFYPTSSAILAFRNELSSYETSRGTVRFPLEEPLPLALVRKIVKFRVQENLARAKRK